MKTALITHADCLDHVTPAGHPEQVARLEHVLHALAPLDLNRITAPLAADDDLLRIHPKSYIDEIKQMRPESGNVSGGCRYAYFTWISGCGISRGGWNTARR